MNSISIIIPSFHSKDLLMIAVKSLEGFCPSDFKLNYIVVENSNDVSYKDEVLNVVPDALWINNDTKAVGSEANAEAIIVGLQSVQDGLVFMCHCDICVTSSEFLPMMVQKYQEGNKLIGTCIDIHSDRIKAVHISGLLVETEIARKIDYMPNSEAGLDVGDRLTQYCRNNNIHYYCFGNTYSNPELISLVRDLYQKFSVDRCIDENNNVVFMHLGRGIPKTQATYNKPGKVYLKEWVDFCTKII